MNYLKNWASGVLVICLAAATGATGNTAEKKENMKHLYTLNAIGTVQTIGDETKLVLNPDLKPALLGLDGFSHIWVFWWFDKNDTPEKRAVLQVHPRGNQKNPLTGVFATRSPVRPNLIAQTLCKVVRIEETEILIENIDAFDDTPVLDIKPYIPRIDETDARLPAWIGR